MASHKLRRFGNLEFLQSIDKPSVLRLLRAPYESYLRQNDIDINLLSNDDESDRTLLTLFTRPDARMPNQLLHDLYLLDALADEDGHQRIIEEAQANGVNLSAIPKDTTPGDLAILMHHKYPQLISECYEKTVARQVKRYHEFRSRDARRFEPRHVERAVADLTPHLGDWFEGQRRTRACEVFAYCQEHEVHMLVTHGAPFRADGNITNRLQFSRIPWRPQKHDSVIYDGRTGILKVNARFPAERKLYREGLGLLLAEDAGYFLEGPSYTLAPLRQNCGILALADGITEVRLTEAVVETGSYACREIIARGADLAAMVAGLGPDPLQPGEIVRAAFLIRYACGGRPRKLDVRLPNVADYDRNRDGLATEAFLFANGLVP